MGALVTEPISALRERLASADPEQRRRACQTAAESASAVFLVDALGEALGDPVKAVARAASDALAEIGTRMGGVEGAIRAALRSDVPARRWGAAFTAARLEPPDPALLPPLVEALGSDDGDVRWAAARLIVEVGRRHGEVLPLLLELARSGEPAVLRRMASFALRELAPDRAETAEALAAASRDSDLQVRRAALTAMAALIAPPPRVASRLLEAIRGDDDPASRRLAALALGEIGAANPGSLPLALLHQLREHEHRCEDPDLRRALRRALSHLDRQSDRGRC
jgi:HEAT repeat protein